MPSRAAPRHCGQSAAREVDNNDTKKSNANQRDFIFCIYSLRNASKSAPRKANLVAAYVQNNADKAINSRVSSKPEGAWRSDGRIAIKPAATPMPKPVKPKA